MIGIKSCQLNDCVRASAMRLTSTAPRYTAIGGIAALIMPSSENRISDCGEAAQANARANRRFFRTLCARPLAGSGLWLIARADSVPQNALTGVPIGRTAPIRAAPPKCHCHGRGRRIAGPFIAAALATQLDDNHVRAIAGAGRVWPAGLASTLRAALRVKRVLRRAHGQFS